MIKKKWVIVIDAIISLLLIGAILYFMNLEKLIEHFTSINLFYLFAAILFLLLLYVIMSIRISLLLAKSGVNISLLSVLRSHIVGMLAADFTPARSGYFATAGMLHYKYKVPSEKALMSILGPQVFDFSLKLIAGTLAIIYLLWNFLEESQAPYVFAGSVILLFMIVVMLLLLFSKPFLRLFSFAEKLPVIGRVYSVFERMQKHSHIVANEAFSIAALTILGWSAKALSWYFVAKAVGISLNLPFPEVFFYYFFQALVTILEFMPLPTIAGAGASEAAGVFVMLFFNVEKEAALSFMLLARVKTILVNLISMPDAWRLTKTAVKDIM